MCTRDDPILAPTLFNCGVACASIAYSATFHVHRSECMKNTTKHYLTHSKLAVSSFNTWAPHANSGENLPKS